MTAGSAKEGTAVFIGRASFRMIPVAQSVVSVARNDVSIQQGNVVATGENTATSARDAAWFDQGDEKVVLSPPETNAPSESPFDGLANHPGDGGNSVNRHRSFPLWTIAAALVAGVTITLSAQAVMKSRGRFAVPAKLADSIVAAPVRAPVTTGTALPPNTALPVPPSAPRPVSPTVVPSTIIWAVNAQSPPRQIARAAAIDRPRQARAVQTTPAAKRAPRVTWVDPFAGGDENSAISGMETSHKSARPVTPARIRPVSATPQRKTGHGGTGVWVDPFAE